MSIEVALGGIIAALALWHMATGLLWAYRQWRKRRGP